MNRILCLRIENQDRRVGGARKASDDGALREPVQNNDQRFQGSDSVRNPPSSQRFAPRTLQAVAAQCRQFTPLVGIDPHVFPQSVLLDITNVVHLFGGEAALVQQILGTLQAEGWHFRAAVADTPGAAWALAGYGEKSGRWTADGEQRVVDGHPAILPQATGLNGVARSLPVTDDRQPTTDNFPSAVHRPLSTLPLEALRLPGPIVALLHSLGVWRIEQLQALPRRELSSRFGPELLDCLDRVTGRLSEPLPAWDPPPPLEVCWSAEFPTDRREVLCAALEHLARRLAAMLTRAGRGAMRLECLLNCTAGRDTSGHLGTPRGTSGHLGAPRGTCAAGRRVGGSAGRLQVVVGLFRPTAWANHLVELLQVRFESLQLPGAVASIRLAAVSTAPLELRQQELFSEGRWRAAPRHLAGLIDRLSNRLGHTRVMRVRLVSEAQPELACHYAPLVLGRADIKGAGTVYRAGRQAGSAARESHKQYQTPLSQPRPLRLLARPVRLPEGIEGPFSFAGRRQPIVRRMGPERIETGWWRGRGASRDYYRIETAAGRCYWVFRRLPAGPWFLHGMFD